MIDPKIHSFINCHGCGSKINVLQITWIQDKIECEDCQTKEKK